MVVLRWLCVVVCLASSSVAVAKESDAYAYPFDTVWAVAIRLLRVDYNYQIQDKDEAVGYILFEGTEKDGARGSIELVRFNEGSSKLIRVWVHMQKSPSYVERLLLNKLAAKLKSEIGEPVVAPPATAAKTPAATSKGK